MSSPVPPAPAGGTPGEEALVRVSIAYRRACDHATNGMPKHGFGSKRARAMAGHKAGIQAVAALLRAAEYRGASTPSAAPAEREPNALDVLALARLAAKRHHYALAVHGSMARDLDLIAVPWKDRASEPEVLVEAIRKAVDGVIFVAEPDGREGYYEIDEPGKHSPVERPHGRRAWSIYNVLGGSYIDLSVMPLRAPTGAAAGEPSEVDFRAAEQEANTLPGDPVVSLADVVARGKNLWHGDHGPLSPSASLTVRFIIDRTRAVQAAIRRSPSPEPSGSGDTP